MNGLRPDLAVIAANITDGSRVLDVGCGDGTLMAALRDTKSVDVRGIELSGKNVATCVAKGLAVMQGDAEADLIDYPDTAFDYVILSETLQTTRQPDKIIEQLLRVGRKVFVSFPNFAHWRVRSSLMFGGQMPVTRLIPVAWYETLNIHHLTIRDFRQFVLEREIIVEKVWFLAGDKNISAFAANLRAEHAIFLLHKSTK